MLPSMPVLFSRESQDAFGNKIEPSTSFFHQNTFTKPAIQPEPPPPKVVIEEPVKTALRETKPKASVKKKEDPPKFDNNALETALVRSYYSKVQSRFSSNSSVPNNKFIQFQNILKTFNPSKESPVELYKRIEQLLGEEHPDILEDFLLFLKPGQAANVGRFMDHLMLVQMTTFIEILHSAFYRKPTVLRKILRAITTGINSGSGEVMKTRVLPHLRSNPRLIQMFKSLFPDERPPDSAYETGVDAIPDTFISENIENHEYEAWEFQDETDKKNKVEAKEGLDTMYLHGRVFLQHGRLLRSSNVTYPYSKEPYRVHARRLAPAHCQPSPPESEDERASPKRNRNSKVPPKKPKKQLKSPTKNVKDVNGNTKVKDLTAVLSSPKTVKSKPPKKKEKRDDGKQDIQKRERKDSKPSCPKKDEGSKPKQPKIETVCVEAKTEVKGNSWTRDEDKTMLQVLKGEAHTEQVFGRIRELLPHRSVTEIKERFCHVMTLLQQMAVGEVT